MTTDIKELVKEARGWHAGRSDDSQRMVWLMNKLSDALGTMAGELNTATANLKGVQQQVRDLVAENDRLKAALEAIQHSQLKRKVAHHSRTDGKRSIYDLCEHKVMMKDTCEDCIQDFARKALGDAS